MRSFPFSDVLAYLEEHGWELMRISEPYRIFEKPGRLPIMVPVENRMVEARYVRKIKEIIEKEWRDASQEDQE